MTKKKIIEVFKDINNPDYNDKEKLEAISEIRMQQGMYSKVSKHDIISAFNWMMNYYFANGTIDL